MVVIFWRATEETGTTHDRRAAPSTWTVQAPHCPSPQPYFVPVRRSSSRKTQRRGVSGSTFTDRDRPLTVRVNFATGFECYEGGTGRLWEAGFNASVRPPSSSRCTG